MLTGIKIKNYFPKEKQSANIALLVNSIKHTRKKKKIQILQKLFHKIENAC